MNKTAFGILSVFLIVTAFFLPDSASAGSRMMLKTASSSLMARPRTAVKVSLRKPRHVQVPLNLAKLRDNEREFILKKYRNAFDQYQRDHKGESPPGLKWQEQEFCRTSAKNCEGLLDLRMELAPYMQPLPEDPLIGDESDGTGITVRTDYKGKLYFKANLAELRTNMQEGKR